MRVWTILQIHGSVNEPATIVFSREGYRNLLHDRPNYRDFLKATMMSRTILYAGFSFTGKTLLPRDRVVGNEQFRFCFYGTFNIVRPRSGSATAAKRVPNEGRTHARFRQHNITHTSSPGCLCASDDYLNEIRSDVMAMLKHSATSDRPDQQRRKTLAYAIINDKEVQSCRNTSLCGPVLELKVGSTSKNGQTV